MIWFHSIDFRITSFLGQLVVVALYLGVFVFHGIYLASILEGFAELKESQEPFEFMTYENFMNNKHNKLEVPKDWGSWRGVQTHNLNLLIEIGPKFVVV